jgi:hypothetical protein
MKTTLIATALGGSFLIIGINTQAQYSVYNNTVGTQFQSTPIDPSGTGSLGFSDALTTPSGSTIAGGSAVGLSSDGAIGETFLWSGATTTLTAFSFVDTGGGGVGTYQPFLFDLSSPTYGGSATGFIPGDYSNLLPTGTVEPPALGSGLNALEIDLSIPVTLVSGQSYALGFQSENGTVDIDFQKSSGGQSDPDGEGFTFTGGLSSSSADNPSPFSGSPRNLFTGLYTEAVPEPSCCALLGGALAAIGVVRRFKK